MKKKILLPLLLAVIGIGVSLFIATAKPKPQPLPVVAAPLQKVSVLELSLASEQLQVMSQGQVKARRRIDLSSQLGGQIVFVDDQFLAGGYVQQGQTLLRLEPRDYEIAVVRAQAAVAQARAQLATEQGLAREAQSQWQDLGSGQANDLFLRKAQLSAAEAQLAAAQADLEQAELNLQRTRIQAPFDGRIVQVFAELGQFINAGSRVADIFDGNSLEVALPVSATETRLLDLSATHAVKLSSLESEQSWSASITRSAAALDESSRQLSVFATLDANQASQPYLGQFLSARISGKVLDGVLTLPLKALRADDTIWTLDENNTLRIKQLEVLQVDGHRVKLRSSQQQGNIRVIMSYLAAAQEGMRLDPVVAEARQ